MNNWEKKITKMVEKILNMKDNESIRFHTFVIKKFSCPGGCKWQIYSYDEKFCKGVLYADCYDNDTQFTNDLIGLIF